MKSALTRTQALELLCKYNKEPFHRLHGLTGLIGAAAKMRPSKSTKDMELSSLKKKFKDKKFAAGCSRDVIRRGADQLGWELDKLMEQTILAMRSCEDRVNKEMEELEF